MAKGRRAAGGLQRSVVAPPALVTTSLAKFEESLGGRDVLLAGLAHAPRTKDLDYVVGLVGDPQHARVPLAMLCAMGGITAGELLDAYKAGELARGQALGAKFIGDGLPAVIQDTFKRAAPYEATCYQCQGTGTIVPEPTDDQPNPDPVDCPLCAHTGVLTYQGDLEHKKLALELGRMLQKAGGVNVNVSQKVAQIGGASVGGSLEALQRATDDVLYGGGAAGDPLEGELLSGEEAGGEAGEHLEPPPAPTVSDGPP